jgi:hypothetical protein
MERVGDSQETMEGYCSTGQSPQRSVLPVEKRRRISGNKHMWMSVTFKFLYLKLLNT